ncbi:hypothetical protein DFR86_06930 [Acidianus sulfidivorans JP7]|uniref:Uncharacterized protein n=1 Tax=Acidianus sulfidivorans JP7 TaxID=619593 RepID=A0A2U9IMR0_9CREN|nr:hypothetical protein [Acidianus sulfidivorans]AWR97311.1 hypothetical protein DFR86_06930 [Acidianus sulfidivorans JP7]
MKLLFVIINNLSNKEHLLEIISKFNGYLFPEIVHIPISAFNWSKNCYSLDKITQLLSVRFNRYPVNYVIAISNLDICENVKNTINDKIVLINEKLEDLSNVYNTIKNLS